MKRINFLPGLKDDTYIEIVLIMSVFQDEVCLGNLNLEDG